MTNPEHARGLACGYNDASSEATPKRIRTRKNASPWTLGYWDGWNQRVTELASQPTRMLDSSHNPAKDTK